jgi:hypothetical protein
MPTSRKRLLLLIVAAAIIGRMLLAALTVDLSRDYYWEYGEIVKNLHAGKGYALYHVENGQRLYRFDPSADPLPSAFMSPGYVWFLYPFFFIDAVVVRNIFLLFVQALLGGLNALLVAWLADRYYMVGSGVWAASILALLPEFVYASTSFTPTVLYHTGLLVFLIGVYELQRHESPPAALGVGIIGGGIVLLRSEFIVCAVLCGLWFVILGRRRAVLLLTVGLCVVWFPWVLRNSIVFGEFVPLSTSSGLNLFRGHNGDEYGAWTDESIEREISRLPVGPALEARMNDVYWHHTLTYIQGHPAEEIGLLFRKGAYLWGMNPLEPRSRNPYYFIPWGGMLLLAVLGAYTCRSHLSIHMPAVLFLFASTLVAVAFFVLPRYQTMMKPALVPFVAVGWLRLLEKLEFRWNAARKALKRP